MPMTEPAYFTAFKNFAFTRTPSGVLTLRFHTEGGPAMFTGQMHADFPRALYEIGEDRDNRVLVLTGTGDRFMTDIDGQSLDGPTKPAVWDKTTAEGRRIMQRLVDLEMPIVAAVNSDFPHLTFGIVPGHGIYLGWEEAVGLTRGSTAGAKRATSGPAQKSVQDVIVTGTRPIGQTVFRRARAAGPIVAEVEGVRRASGCPGGVRPPGRVRDPRARRGPGRLGEGTCTVLTRGHRQPWVTRHRQRG